MGDKKERVRVVVSAPGKVILHGEHSVVYGKLAIAGSLGLRTRVELEEVEGRSKIGVELRALGLEQSYDLEDVRELLRKPPPLMKGSSTFTLEHPELLDHKTLLESVSAFLAPSLKPLNHSQKLALNALFYLLYGILSSSDVEIQPFIIKIGTQLTLSAGTGSSASCLVSVAALFLRYVHIKTGMLKNGFKPPSKDATFDPKDLDLISRWAYCAERIVHGTPSGVDNTICTYGSLVEFRKSTGARKLQVSSKFKVLLVNTKVSRNTKALVEGVVDLKAKYGEVVEAILDAMDGVAKEALRCFAGTEEEGEMYMKLGELADLNQHLLAALNVSHPKLDAICRIVKEAGLHGKLTGAGGGGYAIALIPPRFEENVLNRLVQVLIGDGFEAVVTDLGGHGVTIDE